MNGKSKFLWTLSMNALSCQRGSSSAVRSISTSPIMCKSPNGGVNDNNSHESADDFERRIFSRFLNNDPNANSFYQKLDKLEKARGKTGADDSQLLDGLGDGFDTLSDGMDDKLKKAATTFVYSDEMKADDYAFRPDVNFLPGMEYSPKDLDLRNLVYRKPLRRPGFETTTAEVLKKADFRNVRFLANFITESGIIIKRRKTGISAKAQRKVAREIKTTRAFGLMPFTTMGTKTFIIGKTMEDTEEDYEFDKSGPRFTGAKETPF